MRLYKAHILPDYTADDLDTWGGDLYVEAHAPATEAEGAPAGWDAHCRDVWGEPRPFFLPSDRPIYRARSSAQRRVDLINRWAGPGTAILVETETEWIHTPAANARRRRARNAARIERLREEIRRLGGDA